jgi:hypothetical protein
VTVLRRLSAVWSMIPDTMLLVNDIMDRGLLKPPPVDKPNIRNNGYLFDSHAVWRGVHVTLVLHEKPRQG